MVSDRSMHVRKNDDLFPVVECLNPVRAAFLTVVMIALSVGLYLIAFSNIRKPFSIGIYSPLIKSKIEKLNETESPRILIVAGSNARISHQAYVLEKETGIPSTNGGLTADLSLEFLLATYEPHLKRGDLVYLPLEYQPLCLRSIRTKSERVYLASYALDMLSELPLRDRLDIWFCFELGDLFSEIIERQAARSSVIANRRAERNRWGDQVGYTMESAKRFRDRILNATPESLPRSSDFRKDSRTKIVLRDFMERCTKRGITVIGGLPTTFVDRNIDADLIKEIRSFYESHGHHFVLLDNKSQYPRNMFYDSPYHLIDSAAAEHTRLLASEIIKIIERL
jgi:hypothetical protein